MNLKCRTNSGSETMLFGANDIKTVTRQFQIYFSHRFLLSIRGNYAVFQLVWTAFFYYRPHIPWGWGFSCAAENTEMVVNCQSKSNFFVQLQSNQSHLLRVYQEPVIKLKNLFHVIIFVQNVSRLQIFHQWDTDIWLCRNYYAQPIKLVDIWWSWW